MCRDSFIGITCQLFDHKRKFRKTFHFCLLPFYEQHNAANIMEKVTRIMDEFSKVNFVCTDNTTSTTSRRHYSSNIEVLATGVKPAVGAEAENSLAHTLELRFLKIDV